jgi:hypothetical protein
MALNGMARLEAFLVCLFSPVATQRAFAPTGTVRASCPAAPTAAPCRTKVQECWDVTCCTMLHHVAPCCSRAEPSQLYQLFRSTDSGAIIRKGPEICLTSNCAAAKQSQAKPSRAVQCARLGPAHAGRRWRRRDDKNDPCAPSRPAALARAAESPAQLARVCLPALWDTAGSVPGTRAMMARHMHAYQRAWLGSEVYRAARLARACARASAC